MNTKDTIKKTTMRDLSTQIKNHMPLHEREWDARLFIDQAIKANVEYHLETIARALSGDNKISIDYAHGDPFEAVNWIDSDDKGFVKMVEKYKISAKMGSFCFYANNMIGIWIRIIDFWAGKVAQFPCGGAANPWTNSKSEEDFKERIKHLPLVRFARDMAETHKQEFPVGSMAEDALRMAGYDVKGENDV